MQKIGQMMGIYKSAVSEYVPCACRAFLKLSYQVNKWRNESERIKISTRYQKMHGFVNCVGSIDGTLFPLAFTTTLSAEDHFTRKICYAIEGLIICDNVARSNWTEIGWLGSVYDNRIWSDSDINCCKTIILTTKTFSW